MSTWLALVEKLLPFVLSAIPKVPPSVIPIVMKGISDAEQIPGATGVQKKAAVMALVTDGLSGVDAVTGKPTVDVAGITNAVSQGIDTGVAVVNLVHAAQTPAAVVTE